MTSSTETARPGSVTCVVVAYNHARFVEQCLDSAFAQTYEDVRVIVFDDASPDDSQQVIRDYLARTGHDDVTFVAHTDNRGLCATLNEALELVDTEFVAFISADDWMIPERFEIQVAALIEYGPGAGFSYSDMARRTTSGEIIECSWFENLRTLGVLDLGPRSGNIYQDLLREFFISAPTMLVRTGIYRDLGNFDDTLRFEDVDMSFRLAEVSDAIYIDQPLVNYRITPNSLGDTIHADPIVQSAEHRRIFTKHIGRSPAIDQIIGEQLYKEVKRGYLAGGRPCDYTADIKLASQLNISAKTLSFVVLTYLRIPGRAVRKTDNILVSARNSVRSWRSKLRRDPESVHA